MKTLKSYALMLGILVSSTTLYSCLDDDGYYPDDTQAGIVTIKPLSDKSYFMQLDDNTTLWPANSYVPSDLKERRARILFTFEKDSAPKEYTHSVQILRMDTILTKSLAENKGELNDSIYGKNSVRLNPYSQWAPGGAWIEDNYITFDFLVYVGGSSTTHFMNLVKSADPSKPYELEFRHKLNGYAYDTEQNGLVSFKLDGLPSTEGKTVKLKVKHKTRDGEKSFELDYKSK